MRDFGSMERLRDRLTGASYACFWSYNKLPKAFIVFFFPSFLHLIPLKTGRIIDTCTDADRWWHFMKKLEHSCIVCIVCTKLGIIFYASDKIDWCQSQKNSEQFWRLWVRVSAPAKTKKSLINSTFVFFIITLKCKYSSLHENYFFCLGARRTWCSINKRALGQN